MSQIRPTMAKNNPRGMEMARLGSRAQREFIEAEAIDIFTTMTNGGCTFQQALAAIFMSGMNAANTVMDQKS
jgi:hypothetical protein